MNFSNLICEVILSTDLKCRDDEGVCVGTSGDICRQPIDYSCHTIIATDKMCVKDSVKKECHDIALNEKTCRNSPDFLCLFDMDTEGKCLDPINYTCVTLTTSLCYLPQTYYCQDTSNS